VSAGSPLVVLPSELQQIGTSVAGWPAFGPIVQVQVQVCFSSVDGQVQPLDVALGHSVLSKSMR
jgi:hypothetical protein